LYATCESKRAPPFSVAHIVTPALQLDHRNICPLRVAAQRGNGAAAKLLLESKARPDGRPESLELSGGRLRHTRGGGSAIRYALHAAAQQKAGGTLVVNHLIHHQADPNVVDHKGRTALHVAARFGLDDVVAVLLEKRADLDHRDDSGRSVLHVAAQYGHARALLTLLDADAGVDARDDMDRTALYAAVASEHVTTAGVLLQRRASPSIPDKLSRSPLHVACCGTQPEVVQLLINHHALVTLCDLYGRTPLHFAAEWGREELVRAIAQAPVGQTTINQVDNLGRSALHAAAENGHLNAVQTLLENGADKSLGDLKDHTALDAAVFYRQYEVALYLLERGAAATRPHPFKEQLRATVNRQQSRRMSQALALFHHAPGEADDRDGNLEHADTGSEASVQDDAARAESIRQRRRSIRRFSMVGEHEMSGGSDPDHPRCGHVLLIDMVKREMRRR